MLQVQLRLLAYGGVGVERSLYTVPQAGNVHGRAKAGGLRDRTQSRAVRCSAVEDSGVPLGLLQSAPSRTGPGRTGRAGGRAEGHTSGKADCAPQAACVQRVRAASRRGSTFCVCASRLTFTCWLACAFPHAAVHVANALRANSQPT